MSSNLKNNVIYWGVYDFIRDEKDFENWLHPNEQEFADSFKFDKRKFDFINGRIGAKKLLTGMPMAGFVSLSPLDIEIIKKEDGSPDTFIKGNPLIGDLSLSHGHGSVLCCYSPNARTGCDLEKIENRSDVFIESYFTDKEQIILGSVDRLELNLMATLFWSSKECVVKINKKGLSRDTRSIEVVSYSLSNPHQWTKICVEDLLDEKEYYGYWKTVRDIILVIMSDNDKFILMP